MSGEHERGAASAAVEGGDSRPLEPQSVDASNVIASPLPEVRPRRQGSDGVRDLTSSGMAEGASLPRRGYETTPRGAEAGAFGGLQPLPQDWELLSLSQMSDYGAFSAMPRSSSLPLFPPALESGTGSWQSLDRVADPNCPASSVPFPAPAFLREWPAPEPLTASFQRGYGLPASSDAATAPQGVSSHEAGDSARYMAGNLFSAHHGRLSPPSWDVGSAFSAMGGPRTFEMPSGFGGGNPDFPGASFPDQSELQARSGGDHTGGNIMVPPSDWLSCLAHSSSSASHPQTAVGLSGSSKEAASSLNHTAGSGVATPSLPSTLPGTRTEAGTCPPPSPVSSPETEGRDRDDDINSSSSSSSANRDSLSGSKREQSGAVRGEGIPRERAFKAPQNVAHTERHGNRRPPLATLTEAPQASNSSHGEIIAGDRIGGGWFGSPSGWLEGQRRGRRSGPGREGSGAGHGGGSGSAVWVAAAVAAAGLFGMLLLAHGWRMERRRSEEMRRLVIGLDNTIVQLQLQVTRLNSLVTRPLSIPVMRSGSRLVAFAG
eukprot:TRINITY_DN4589_c0_g1_i1.p1 TRINITY_DN4589_c0_g1~~TRINITY_DN4589_c0_g1_i1.p1  ORF type:complete len:545 (+),score=87.19 TRINITY_DN4589_c0_g1_i1:228-1862(+)